MSRFSDLAATRTDAAERSWLERADSAGKCEGFPTTRADAEDFIVRSGRLTSYPRHELAKMSDAFVAGALVGIWEQQVDKPRESVRSDVAPIAHDQSPTARQHDELWRETLREGREEAEAFDRAAKGLDK